MSFIKKYAWYGSAVVASLAFAVALLLVGPAEKAHAAASTGGALTALIGTNGLTGTGAYGTVSNIVLTEAAAADISAAANTLTIAAPGGWNFNTADTLAVTGGGADITVQTAVVTSVTLITVSITATGTATTDVLTITGVTARPINNGTAAGPTAGNWAVTGGAVAGIAATQAVTFTATVSDMYVSNATPVGNTVIQVTAQAAGLSQVSMSSTAGTFAVSGVGLAFCVDGQACDVDGAANNIIQLAFFVPVTGAASITVTPIGGGTAETITVTATLAEDLGSIVITPAAAVTATADGVTPAVLTFSAKNLLSLNFSTAKTLTVTTTQGVINSVGGAGTSCTIVAVGTLNAGSDAVCDAAWTGTDVIIEVYGNGISGTATVTVTGKNTALGTISATKSVAISGSPTAATATVQVDADGAGAGTTFIAASTPNAATLAAGGGSRIEVKVVDALGNPAAATLTATPSTGLIVGTSVAGVTGTYTFAITTVPATAGTVNTVTIKIATTTLATVTITSGGTTTDSIVVTAPDIAPVTVGSISASPLDSGGKVLGDGTVVTMVVTAGSLITTTSTTIDGSATFVYVSPGATQSVNATAVIGSKTGSATFLVSGSVPVGGDDGEDTGGTQPGEGGFDLFGGASLPASGFASATAQGGSVEALRLDADSAGVTLVIVFVDGSPVALVTGTNLAIVNAAFDAAFPNGITAGQPMTLVVGG